MGALEEEQMLLGLEGDMAFGALPVAELSSQASNIWLASSWHHQGCFFSIVRTIHRLVLSFYDARACDLIIF